MQSSKWKPPGPLDKYYDISGIEISTAVQLKSVLLDSFDFNDKSVFKQLLQLFLKSNRSRLSNIVTSCNSLDALLNI